MKIEDLITLAKAGFTKDEIIRLASGESSSNTVPQQPDAPPAPAEKAEPVKEEAPKEAPAEDIGAIVSQKISELAADPAYDSSLSLSRQICPR